eukprot:1447371-Alexandrium_andersonii.AAC.1
MCIRDRPKTLQSGWSHTSSRQGHDKAKPASSNPFQATRPLSGTSGNAWHAEIGMRQSGCFMHHLDEIFRVRVAGKQSEGVQDAC